MLVDDLREIVKSCTQDVNAIKNFYKNAQIQNKKRDLDSVINTEDFWQHPDRISITQQGQYCDNITSELNVIIKAWTDANELLELFADDEDELKRMESQIRSLPSEVREFKLKLLLGKPDDHSNCFLSINAGAGGTESQDWAEMLLRMYLRFCERYKFKTDVLDYQQGEEAGMKSATIHIKGENAFGFLKSEIGIHRLVRISPFDSSKRRHTSFAGAAVTPEVADTTIEINDDDLRIDTYRAGGAGGQHVNKTDSAVRITHIPTGTVVQCQKERSQLQNKQTAMKMLTARLHELKEKERREKEQAIEKKKIEWGSQIRSYVLHPYKMVKDHRTGVESPQPDAVLDGDLIQFIEGYLVKFSETP
ncbi:peptide chain release factor 2 [bacterium]|nr:peptide chain release factor 2 [bacterium]